MLLKFDHFKTISLQNDVSIRHNVLQLYKKVNERMIDNIFYFK